MKKPIYALAALMIPFAAHAADKPLTKAEVEKIVEQVIMEKPEIIIESLKKMQEREAATAATKAVEAMKSRKDDIFNSPLSPVLGNPNGDVTIVEFFDYNCGYCKRIYPSLAQLIAEDKNVRVVMKEFPILSDSSELGARAAFAVHHLAPEKYLPFHAALMTHNGQLDKTAIINAAAKLGISEADLTKAMQTDEVTNAINEDRELGTALNINGTPALIIGEEIIPGAISLEEIKAKIAKLRKK